MAQPKNRLEGNGVTVYVPKLTPEEKEQARVSAQNWDQFEAEADAKAKAKASSEKAAAK
jgi:hypothetical protein